MSYHARAQDEVRLKTSRADRDKSTLMKSPVKILHLHSSFDPGGTEERAVTLMNAFGDRAVHTIVSGATAGTGAKAQIATNVRYQVVQSPPVLTGKPSLRRYEAIAQFSRRFDLVLTYNWAAIDGVMARRVFPRGAPPLVHHEDGFDIVEAYGLKVERNIYRRVALTSADALVVPSQTLEDVALNIWKQPRERVQRIAIGIDTALYGRKPEPGRVPGLDRKAGEIIIGAIADLSPQKDLASLVRAVGGVSGRVKLVIVGEGPDRARIVQAAAAMGIADRLVMPGDIGSPHRFVSLFDIFGLSSFSEQFPIQVLEAMAAGVPIASYPVGEIPRMVAKENLPFITPHSVEVELRDVLQSLVSDREQRRLVGQANAAKAASDYGDRAMIERYTQLYERVLKRPGALG